jgi:hypothetical protein
MTTEKPDPAALQPQGPTTADDAAVLDAFSVCEQTILELTCAVERENNWYADGVTGKQKHVREHVRRAKEATAKARAVLSRMSVPAGYKMVPVEPTEEMLNAAIDAHGLKIGCIAPLGLRMSPQMMFEKSYTAMLAAAPTEVR